MAKRPVQSLDTFGESLLAQQSTRRDKKAKQSRRSEKRMMLLGALVAGQGIVNSALKRRAKEIADRGEFSKLRSKKQAENMSFYAPIFDSIGEHETYADWNKHMEKNPNEYRSLQGHLSPMNTAFAKQHMPAEAADPAKYAREYRHLINDNTNHLVEQAFGVDKTSGMPFSELWKLGTEEFAGKSGVKSTNREDLYSLLTNTTQNSLDAYKAREITAQNSNLSTSVFSKDTFDAALQAGTFNAIKRDKRESSPFKKIDSGQGLIPQNLQDVMDRFDVRTIMKDRFTSQYAVMRDEVAAYSNNTAAVEKMGEVWKAMPGRVKEGTLWDAHRLPGTKREGGHRYTRLRAGLADNVFDFVNKDSNLAMKEDLLQQAGTLAHMIGDPNRPKLKTSIMDQWLELPWVKELGVTKGSAEYRKVYGELDTLTGRQEFALDFTTSLSFKNEKIRGFEVDFSEIKSITGQKFRVVSDDTSGYKGAVFGKKRKLKFEPTEIYKSLNQTEKIRDYDTFLRGILENQTRSNNTTEGLKEVALKFIKDVPSPSGELTEAAINRIVEGSVDSYQQPSFRGGFEAIGGAAEALGNTRTTMPTPEGPVETIQLINPSTIKVHPSINLNSVTPTITWSLSSGRLNMPIEKSSIITNQLLPAIIDVESKFDYAAINTSANSTATGGGQFLKDSLVTAVNRANNIRKENNLEPLKETQTIMDNDARINNLIANKRSELETQGVPETRIEAELQRLAKKEFQSSDSIARKLSPEVQQELILANLFEADGSDAYWKRLLNATTPEEQYEAALDLYLDKHHTNRKDEDTVKVARERFRPYFF